MNQIQKRLRLSVFTLLFVVSSLSSICNAQQGDATEAPELREELKAFAPFIGTWEIDGKWLSGQPIWARSEYVVGMAGNFVEATTYTKDETSGKVYRRYVTIWRWDAENEKVTSHGFTFDGSYTALDPEVSIVDGKATLASAWEQGGTTIKQVVQIIDESSYSWKVATLNGDEESPIMDGVWKKK